MWAATAMARDTREGSSRDCLIKAVMLRCAGVIGDRQAQKCRSAAEGDTKWFARRVKKCGRRWI